MSEILRSEVSGKRGGRGVVGRLKRRRYVYSQHQS